MDGINGMLRARTRDLRAWPFYCLLELALTSAAHKHEAFGIVEGCVQGFIEIDTLQVCQQILEIV